ncbi:MAG: DUF937 domain-containing protein [Saprospiraceae bacterium]|nr:DUF937 domain-containing protein [Saprospiraceae bacterium]
MDLRDLFQGQINDVLVDQISNQFGINNRDQAESAVEGGFTTLLNAISKNVASPSGAEGLAGALDRDHDGSIIDDIAGFLGGTRQADNTNMLNGAGILKHLLGGQQNHVVEMLGKATGLHKSQAGQMLMSLAPVVMGMLGRQKRVNNLDQKSMADLITRGTQNFNRQSPTNTSLITKMLDRDGDGSAMDEIMSMGAKALFGSIFKGSN